MRLTLGKDSRQDPASHSTKNTWPGTWISVAMPGLQTFGDRQRIELGHPAVLIGQNNCGKISAIQALARWSQAIKT